LATRLTNAVFATDKLADGHLGYKIVKPANRRLAKSDFFSTWALLTLWIPSKADRQPTGPLVPTVKFAASECLVLGAQLFGKDLEEMARAHQSLTTNSDVKLVSWFGNSSNSYVWNIGERHAVEGPVRICENGLHFFSDSHSALNYANIYSGTFYVGKRMHGLVETVKVGETPPKVLVPGAVAVTPSKLDRSQVSPRVDRNQNLSTSQSGHHNLAKDSDATPRSQRETKKEEWTVVGGKRRKNRRKKNKSNPKV
jgi:hypothetical protein